ncbi:MAG: response regulator [candidate division Zixibacteria bacterium]|nr:response regulator [candidate division Zixibacteria bacterium]
MKKKVILIIDDEPDVISYLSAVLDDVDYDIHSSDSTADGLEKARKLHPDLICLDIMMPEESGLSLYARLRRDECLATIPVIIISGMESQQEFDFRRYVGDRQIPPPERYIEKPINVEAFVATVRTLISVVPGEPDENTQRQRS